MASFVGSVGVCVDSRLLSFSVLIVIGWECVGNGCATYESLFFIIFINGTVY